jgi:hypothetical protein
MHVYCIGWREERELQAGLGRSEYDEKRGEPIRQVNQILKILTVKSLRFSNHTPSL